MNDTEVTLWDRAKAYYWILVGNLLPLLAASL